MQKAIAFLVLLFVLGVPSVATPAPSVSPMSSAYSPLDYGFDNVQLRYVLRTLFRAAFEEKGTRGQNFLYFLHALNRDYALELDLSDYALDLPEGERQQLGGRDLHPKGKAGLSPEMLTVLKRFPEEMPGDTQKAVQIGEAVERLAASCIAGEGEFNAAVASQVTRSRVSKRLSHGTLRWLIRLRDADCIDQERFLVLAGPLASQASEQLERLGSDERLRAMAIISDAGYHHLISLENLTTAAGLIPKEKGELDTINYVNLDIYLAGTYVLARTLDQLESAAETANVLKQVIQEATQATANIDTTAASQEG